MLQRVALRARDYFDSIVVELHYENCNIVRMYVKALQYLVEEHQ